MEFRIILFLICGVLVSCSSGGEVNILEGKLLFGGQGVDALDLSTGTVRQLIRMDAVSVNDVSFISDNEVLISYFNLLPSKDREKIAVFNIPSGEVSNLANGSKAIYLGASEKIVYKNSRGKFVISMLSNVADSREILGGTTKSIHSPIIVFNDEILFKVGEGDEAYAQTIDFKNMKARRVDSFNRCSFDISIWRSITNELLCADVNANGEVTGKYSLRSIDGKIKNVDLGNGVMRPIVYLPRFDAVIIQGHHVAGREEMFPVYAFLFTDGSLHLINNNTIINGNVAYLNKTAK